MFCQGSDYSDLQKLEEKYQEKLRDQRLGKALLNEENVENANKKLKDQSKLQNAGLMSLADMKDQLKREDEEFRRIERLTEKQRQDEMMKEENELRAIRAKIKLNKKQDEENFQELLRELEMKKEKELRARIEKDNIRRALVDIEKAKLTIVGQEKKKELEKLIAEREILRQRENDLVKDIEIMEQNTQNLEAMRQEDLNKQQQAIDGMQFQQRENNKVNEHMLAERAEKCAILKLRKEQLENERVRINQQLDVVRTGDINTIKKIGGGVNIGLISAKNVLGEMRELGNEYGLQQQKEKLKQNQNRISQLKNEQMGAYRNQMIPFDGDEIAGQGFHRDLADNVAEYYDNYQQRNIGGQNTDNMDAFRENVERMARKQNLSMEQQNYNNLSQYANNAIGDLQILKHDYQIAGGKDPALLSHVQNLEQFYSKYNNNQQMMPPQPMARAIQDRSFQSSSSGPNSRQLVANKIVFDKASFNDNLYSNNYNKPSFNSVNGYNIVNNAQSSFNNYNTPVPLQPPSLNQNQPQQYQRITFSATQPRQPPRPMAGDAYSSTNNNAVMPYQQQNFNSSLHPILQQKEMERQSLLQELSLLTQAAVKQNGPNQSGGGGAFSLGEMVSSNVQAQNPWSIFSPQQEFFVQNEIRSVDLGEEERMLINLTSQEIDMLRVLSRIPVGTELYRVKMEQFKELSATRQEMDKIAQEQRLLKVKRRFDIKRKEQDRRFDNEKWIDDQRKWIIAQRLREDQGTQDVDKDYEPNEGFIIHWDYIIGLPGRTQYAQTVYGIYNNTQTLYAPKLVDAHDCEVESANTVRCIIGDSHQIFDVAPHPDALKIMEVQIPYSKNVEESVGKTESFGWTQMDLFDFKRGLRRGKWRCPLYYGPTNSSIRVEDIKQLEPIPGAWIYFRVAFVNDNVFGYQRSLHPEHTMHEYVIPTIHLRNRMGIGRNFDDDEKLGRGKLPDQSYLPPMQVDKGYDAPPKTYDVSEAPKFGYYDKKPVTPQKIPTARSADSDDGVRRGLEVAVLQVRRHVAKSHFRVLVALLEDINLVTDDIGMPCSFNTTVHNPLDYSEKPPEKMTRLKNPFPQYENMCNKTFDGQNIKFLERYVFYSYLRQVWNRDKKDFYIGIQVVEKPEPSELQDKNIQSTELNYGGLEFELLGWNFYKITLPTEKGGVKFYEGLVEKCKLYRPPIRKPPVDEEKVKDKLCDFEIDFKIELIEYTEENLDKARKERNRKPKDKKAQIDQIAADDFNDLGPAFKKNEKPQFDQGKPFLKNMGIDFYIDGLRFLPDKATIVKVYMEVVNINLETLFEKETALPVLESQAFNPVFDYRRELRAAAIDPTAIALFTILTFDSQKQEVRIVGYSAIQLFIHPFTKKQPSDSLETEFVLYNGKYQIPIFCQQIDRTAPFTIEKVYSHEKLPCSSLLCRINQAPLSDDGLRSLSINEFKDKRIWVQRGLFEQRPRYDTDVYYNKDCKITEAEDILFVSRVNRESRNVKDAAVIVAKQNYKKTLPDSQVAIEQFIDQTLIITPNTFMIDMMYFAKYNKETGVKFILDGIHNVPDTSLYYVGLFSLNPPGRYYPESMAQERDTTSVNLVANYNWESPLPSPQFQNNDFTQYKKEDYNRYKCIIVDIKSVSLKDNICTDVGWAPVPIFSPDGYALSGVYQVPLVKGAVPRRSVKAMQKRDAWELIEELKKTEQDFSMLEFTSIFVRMLDAQREGHFKTPLETGRLDIRYITYKKESWAYNEAVQLKLENAPRVSSMIPDGSSRDKIQKNITQLVANTYNLSKYKQFDLL